MPAALAELRATLGAHGVDRIDERASATGTAPLTIGLGAASRDDIDSALGATEVPSHAEGYAVRADASAGPLGTIALGGVDAAGQYYAVKTLDQLFVPNDDGGYRIAGASISDYPAMPLRGTIEGFYGEPWSHDERLDQIEFYGDVKANTYIYAPKDDPYHRDRWREPYPADKLAELGELVTTATEQPRAVHVRALARQHRLLLERRRLPGARRPSCSRCTTSGFARSTSPSTTSSSAGGTAPRTATAFGAPGARTAGIAQAAFLDRVAEGVRRDARGRVPAADGAHRVLQHDRLGLQDRPARKWTRTWS